MSINISKDHLLKFEMNMIDSKHQKQPRNQKIKILIFKKI